MNKLKALQYRILVYGMTRYTVLLCEIFVEVCAYIILEGDKYTPRMRRGIDFGFCVLNCLPLPRRKSEESGPNGF